MKRLRLRFSILAVMTLVIICAIVFAAIAARPSNTIRVTAHANGSFTCESRNHSAREFGNVLAEAVARRKRWFLTPRTRIEFDMDFEFTQMPAALNLVAAAGCKDVEIGLTRELSSKLSKPGPISESWKTQ